jgi:hypothetical protein
MSQERNADWAINTNRNEDWYSRLNNIPVIREDDLDEWEQWAEKTFDLTEWKSVNVQKGSNND